MKNFKIDYELPNRRAIVLGDYKDLCIDDNVIVYDNIDSYDAVVETRIYGGAVVRVSGIRL